MLGKRSEPKRKRSKGIRHDADELIELLKAYVKQETVGPLRNLGRYIAFGLLGAVFVSIAALLGALALLRVLQTEIDTFAGTWSFVPYLAAAAFCVLVLGAAAKQVAGGEHSARKSSD